jgi:hypothetical protein
MKQRGNLDFQWSFREVSSRFLLFPKDKLKHILGDDISLPALPGGYQQHKGG